MTENDLVMLGFRREVFKNAAGTYAARLKYWPINTPQRIRTKLLDGYPTEITAHAAIDVEIKRIRREERHNGH